DCFGPGQQLGHFRGEEWMAPLEAGPPRTRVLGSSPPPAHSAVHESSGGGDAEGRSPDSAHRRAQPSTSPLASSPHHHEHHRHPHDPHLMVQADLAAAPERLPTHRPPPPPPRALMRGLVGEPSAVLQPMEPKQHSPGRLADLVAANSEGVRALSPRSAAAVVTGLEAAVRRLGSPGTQPLRAAAAEGGVRPSQLTQHVDHRQAYEQHTGVPSSNPSVRGQEREGALADLASLVGILKEARGKREHGTPPSYYTRKPLSLSPEQPSPFLQVGDRRSPQQSPQLNNGTLSNVPYSISTPPTSEQGSLLSARVAAVSVELARLRNMVRDRVPALSGSPQ
ncbi:hypothetical protein CYMTET_50049, partial [Cymbomonas tetramitiformis]